MAEERKDEGRVPFSEDDGVFCVLITPQAPGRGISFPVLDISENGIKFKADAEAGPPFSLWDKLYLTGIAGTRRVEFSAPIELVVRWQENDVNETAFGCQIRHGTPESRQQFVQFVQSEMAFNGYRKLRQKQDAYPGSGYGKKEDEMADWRDVEIDDARSTSQRTRFWALVAVAVFLAMSLASVLYTCKQNRALTERLDRLEQRIRVAPEPSASLEPVQKKLAAIEKSLAGVRDIAQENQSTARSLEGKLRAVEEKMASAQPRPDSGASSPAKEKAAPAPREKSAPAAESAESFHVVQEGENLFRISVKHNVALERLA
jgi:hypothetical protein